MQNVSQAYRDAVQERAYDEVFGTITFVDPEIDQISITPNILPLNAVTISRQCVDNDELMFGGVFTNVLKLSIYTDKDRYAFYNAKIVIGYKIHIGYEDDEPVYEEVPLGIFTVADADRPQSDIVNLTAYDNITMLDMSIGSLSFTGTPWVIFEQITENTGYPLAFDEQFIETLPNYDKPVQVSANEGMRTYRDIVKVLCQELCCFALDDRTGKLALKQFSTTPDLELDISSWYSMTPADYTCNYIGVSITSRSGTYEKMSEDPTAYGLILTVPDAPAWDYGLDIEQEAKTAAMYDVITAIEYTPATINMHDDPSFDCGDMLQLTARNGDVINTIITSTEWKFHSGMEIESVGINPLIEGSSVASSSTDRLVSQAVEKSKIQFINFSNLNAKTLGNNSDPWVIGECRFTPTSLTDSLFIGTILVNVSAEDVVNTETEEVNVPVVAYDEQEQQTVVTDINGNPVTFKGVATNNYIYKRDGKCEVTVYYRIDEIKVPSEETPYLAKAVLENGRNIITLSYPFTNLERGHTYHFEVFITVSCEQGDSVTIDANSSRFTLFGQEVDNLSDFSGYIDVDEPIGLMSYSSITPLTIYEGDIEITQVDAVVIDTTDNVSLYNIASIGVTPIAEGTGSLAPQIFMQGGYNLGTETDDYFAAENDFRFITE